MPVAFDARLAIGSRIRQLRIKRAWTQEDLAERAGLKLITLRDTEGAKRATSFLTIKKLANALEITPDALMATSEENGHARPHAASELRQMLGGEDPSVAEERSAKSRETAQILQYGLEGRKVGGGVAEWARNQERHLSRLDDIMGGKRLYGTAQSNVVLLEQILQARAVDGAEERELRLCLAHMARLTGWLAQDAGLDALAQRYYRHGIETARSVGDHDFAAYCMAMMAFQAVDNGTPELCLTLLDAAENEAAQDSPLHIALSQWAVQPSGLIGDQKTAARKLLRADALWETRDVDRLPDWLYWLWLPSITPEVPRGFIDRDPATAIRLLESGLSAIQSDFQRDRVLFVTGLAEAQCAAGHLDEALAKAMEAVEFISGTPNHRILARLKRFDCNLPEDRIAKEFRGRFLSAIANAGR